MSLADTPFQAATANPYAVPEIGTTPQVAPFSAALPLTQTTAPVYVGAIENGVGSPIPGGYVTPAQPVLDPTGAEFYKTNGMPNQGYLQNN